MPPLQPLVLNGWVTSTSYVTKLIKIIYSEPRVWVSAVSKSIRVQLNKIRYEIHLCESQLTHTMKYPFTVYSLRGTRSVGVTGWFCLWVMFYVFDEWSLGKLRDSLDFLHTTIKNKSCTKRTSIILVNGKPNLIKSIIQRCLLVYLKNMIINDCSSFVIEVPITSRARRYDPSVEPAPKR